MSNGNGTSKLTITEALQEIKTIGKRLEKKRQTVGQYLARDSRFHDPFEKDGGSEKYIHTERQSISDLETRVIAIRTAIQRSNLDSQMAVNGRTMSVAEWLTWRRELATNANNFLKAITNTLGQTRQQVQSKGGKVIAALAQVNEASNPADPPQVVVNVDEKKVIEEQEAMEQTLGDLDGKLSLFNATTVIQA
jgi:hypothetical protein